MAVMTPALTAEDLLRLPDDGFRYELVQGELRQMPPAGYEHGAIAMGLGWRLAQYVENKGIGKVYAAETGFRLSTNPDTVRAPDVAFVRQERVEQQGRTQGYWPGAPDLAVEVISPGDTYAEVEEKAMDWMAAGCLAVVVVNPRRRTMTVYRSLSRIELLTEEETLDLGEVVPGFTLPVKDLFG